MPLEPPAVSVVLCTYNRARLLEGAIEALAGQTPGTPYEVVVVDNASTDDTPAVIEAAVARWPDLVRAVREARQGLSYARNAGIAAATAPIVAFTDDDVRVSADWIGTIARTFAEHPEAVMAGGRVLPRWRGSRPAWLNEKRWAPLGLQDHGAVPFVTGAGRPACLIGANLAVRAAVFAAHGAFDPAVQRVRDGVGSTEDHAFQERLWRYGLIGRYEPSMVVHEEIDPVRLTSRYHRDWHRGHGRFIARMHVPEVEAYGGARLFAVPMHLWRSAAAGLARGDVFPTCFAAGFTAERLHGTPAPPHEPGLTSIVIPCHNQREYVADAMASAVAQGAVEVIVVDDGSTDGSAAEAARFPSVRVIRQRNRGVACARNTGARAARGEFVMFLDADDRLRPAAVSTLRRALAAAPGAGFAYGRFALIDAGGSPLPSSPPVRREGTAYEGLLQSNFVCLPGAAIVRRETLLAAGGFPGRMDPAADYAVWLRLTRTAPVAAVDALVAEYRTHHGSMSGRADRMLAATLRAHARERSFARAAGLRRAWLAGREYWRNFYGSQLVDQARSAWRTRNLARLLRDLSVLAFYAPGVLALHARRKIRLAAGAHRTRYSTNRPSS